MSIQSSGWNCHLVMLILLCNHVQLYSISKLVLFFKTQAHYLLTQRGRIKGQEAKKWALLEVFLLEIVGSG